MQPDPNNLLPEEEEAQLPFDRFWEEHKSHVFLGAAILVIVGLCAVGWMAWDQSRREAAEILLATADSPGQWREIVSRHPGTPAAENARLLLAAALKATGDAPAAATLYDEIISPAGDGYPLQAAAALGLAELAAASEPDSPDLASKFQQAATRFPNSYVAPYCAYSAGDILTRIGRDQEAASVFRNLAADYQESPLARMASMQIQALAGAKSKPSNPAGANAPDGAQPAPTPAGSPAP